MDSEENGWRSATLADLVRLRRGHDLPEPKRRPGHVPVMGSAGISGYHDEARATGPGVVVGRSGASFGKVHYSTTDYWPLNTALYATDFLGNDPRFIFYLLQTLDLTSFNSGSAQPSLNRNFIAQIDIRIPPPDDQRRIASVLGALDDKIESNSRIVALRRELLAAECGRKRAKDRRRVALGSVAEITVGGVWGEESESEKRHCPASILRGIDVHVLSKGGDPDAPQRWVTEREVETRQLQDGDIVVEGSGECGRTLLWLEGLGSLFPGPVLYTNFCRRLRPSGGPAQALATWLQLVEMKESGALEAFKTGTAMPNLDVKAMLANAEVWVPAGADAQHLLELGRTLLDPAPLRENRVLSQLRDALLPKLVSGRLRVQDVEADPEGAVAA